ncbi:MAG: SLC13 family permease [Opitutales bacterium]
MNPAKILLPMSTAALVGANLTLIGAGHNLVVHSLLEDAEGRGFGFFEFTVVGVALLVATLVYTSLLGVRLLAKERRGSPEREAAESADLIEVYDLKERLSEVWVTRRCAKKALTVEDLGLRERFGLTLLELVREEEILKTEKRTRTLREGDTLLLAGRREQVEELCAAFPGLEGMGTPRAKEKYPVSSAELAEGVVPARSPVIGKSAKDLGFRERYGLCAIAYYRNGRPYRTFAQTEPYKEGDAILFYGPRDQMRDFDPEKDLLVYFKPGGPEVSARMRKRAPLAAAILALVVLVAAFDLVPIAVSALGGAVAMILTGIMNSFKSYRAIDWRTIVLIGGMYPLGLALEQTGAAELVGSGLVGLLGTLGPLAVMGGVVVLTIVLTQPIHNAAVAIIMTPIAINAAAQMGSSPRAFCVGVLVGCSLSFLMPFGHPAPLLVQEPGGYSKGDYIRYGLPLVLIALAVILLVVPLLWPL